MRARELEPLSEETLRADPIEQFRDWFQAAQDDKEVLLPEACCLSTVGADGYPEGRMVLLKDVDARGFTFYTNMRSPKGRALAAAPRAALTFHWARLKRQVRAQGDVELVSAQEADAYFRQRPRSSQLAAWASEQSERLESRARLEERMAEMERRFADGEVPRPPHWSGYRLLPRGVEFWQERPSRLHDRFLFQRGPDGRWFAARLFP